MRRWKIEEERVVIIKARMNKSCSNKFGSKEIKCIALKRTLCILSEEKIANTEGRNEVGNNVGSRGEGWR